MSILIHSHSQSFSSDLHPFMACFTAVASEFLPPQCTFHTDWISQSYDALYTITCVSLNIFIYLDLKYFFLSVCFLGWKFNSPRKTSLKTICPPCIWQYSALKASSGHLPHLIAIVHLAVSLLLQMELLEDFCCKSFHIHGGMKTLPCWNQHSELQVQAMQKLMNLGQKLYNRNKYIGEYNIKN